LSDAITCVQRTVVEPGLYDAITCALPKKKEDMLNERKRRNLPNSFDIL
jgi:hypothetical protein